MQIYLFNEIHYSQRQQCVHGKKNDLKLCLNSFWNKSVFLYLHQHVEYGLILHWSVIMSQNIHWYVWSLVAAVTLRTNLLCSHLITVCHLFTDNMIIMFFFWSILFITRWEGCNDSTLRHKLNWLNNWTILILFNQRKKHKAYTFLNNLIKCISTICISCTSHPHIC